MSISTGFADKAEQSVNENPPLFAPGYMVPFVLVAALFLFWGIPSNMNDILIKKFMKSFEITRFRAGLIQSAFYMGYFLLAMPATLVMRKYSYKTVLMIGLLLYGTGTFLFWPAALRWDYGFFLFALFVIATRLERLRHAAAERLEVGVPVGELGRAARSGKRRSPFAIVHFTVSRPPWRFRSNTQLPRPVQSSANGWPQIMHWSTGSLAHISSVTRSFPSGATSRDVGPGSMPAKSMSIALGIPSTARTAISMSAPRRLLSL